MKIHFPCPGCERPGKTAIPAVSPWQCPYCDHLLTLPPSDDLQACLLCSTRELYKKKDFPHWLGLSILTVACLGFLAGHALYQPWLAWTILIGSAAFDGLLYFGVGDAVVCYRCGATYRGFATLPTHSPFELGVAERYRQERLRREQLQADKKHPA